MRYLSKLILTPEYRRRDRRAGEQSETLKRVLSRPSGGRAGTRVAADKRRALTRLLGRYRAGRLGRWPAPLGVVGVVAVVALGVYGTTRTADSVPYESDPAAYDRLATALEASCREGACGYGWQSGGRPPAEARRLMARLRVRMARHDRRLGRSTFQGTHGASFRLVYEHPATAGQRRARARAARADAERDSVARAEGWRPLPRPVPLGGGWLRQPLL